MNGCQNNFCHKRGATYPTDLVQRLREKVGVRARVRARVRFRLGLSHNRLLQFQSERWSGSGSENGERWSRSELGLGSGLR
jgi:hypothetical protein